MELAWIRPRGASLEELRDQLGHAQRVHDGALQAAATALGAFDDTGSEASAKALEAADKAAEKTARVLARAKRLLDEAKAAKHAEDRRAKERRREELQRLLADVSRDGELTDAAVKAWLAVADAQLARAENELHLTRLDNELVGIEAELGVEEKWVRRNRLGATTHVIAEALRAECQGLPAGPRREVLHTLAFMLAPNGVR
jgi:hypothetical protein